MISQKNIIHPLACGPVTLPSNLIMAPLAGSTSAPFRSLCHRFGVGLTVTELTSAAGIVYDDELVKNRRYLAKGDGESPAAVQLFGADPVLMAQAILRLREHPEYGTYDMVDINMGCPVPKVMKTGAGAALMGKPELAEELVKRAVEAAYPWPVTVKFRSGLDEGRINAADFAKRMERAGAALITVHARTAKQRYAGRADYDVLARVREVATVPFVGNGDLATPNDLQRMHDVAQVDGFMIGRAAMGNPHLFRTLSGGAPATNAEIADGLIDLVAGLTELLGERTAMVEIRPQLAAAVRGRAQAAQWRQRFFTAETPAELNALIRLCFLE